MATKVKDLLYSRTVYGEEEKGNQKQICKDEEIKSTSLCVFSPFAGDRDPHRRQKSEEGRKPLQTTLVS
jgi:hypothetical protein